MPQRHLTLATTLVLFTACGVSRHYTPRQSRPLEKRAVAVEAQELADSADTEASAVARTVYFSADTLQGSTAPQSEPFNTERYSHVDETGFRRVGDHPLSTFSVDVDTASYANVRRYLSWGQLPPIDSIRVEEMINYFSYDYRQPDDDHPFAVSVEVAEAPWNPVHRLARVGIKGRDLDRGQRPASNLVFLIDVSGSMSDENKLPLLKRAFAMMVENLGARDRVALTVYAGAAGLVLPSTPCDQEDDILEALDDLQSGGSTNGGAGIQLAYQIARDNFIEGGVNRVVLATDGDFNVGRTSDGGLVRLVEEKAKSGVFLTVLGFGGGNLNDSMMEQISNKGNGNYFYIDTINEARKTLVEEMSSTLVTIAKDVKIQIEFNPAMVGAYRLIGYENRRLADQDFNDDSKDAGEIGAGHTVTALYELVPAGAEAGLAGVDPLKYQRPRQLAANSGSDELLTVKLRYKRPDGDMSRLMVHPVADAGAEIDDASEDFKLAAAVAGFGMLLCDSKHKGEMTWDLALDLADDGRGDDRYGYRGELIALMEKASELRR